jgi:drug/metabolite transporter (DMT)-like permease
VVWSSAGIVVRIIESAGPWQISFYRSAGLIPTMLLTIVARHGRRAPAAFRAIGASAVVGAAALAISFTANIFSLVHTTVANTLFILSTAPFFAAVLGWLVLNERVPVRTWAAMTAALAGVGIMVGEGFRSGSPFGTLIALPIAVGFAAFIVCLRRGRTADMTPAVCLAGAIGLALSGIMADTLAVGGRDLLLCLLLGAGQIGLGLILFTLGARHLKAVESSLLALSEVVLGPLWVWLGVGETPSSATLAGGVLVLLAVVFESVSGARGAGRGGCAGT